MNTEKGVTTVVYREREGIREPVAVILSRPQIESRARVYLLEEASPEEIAELITGEPANISGQH